MPGEAPSITVVHMRIVDSRVFAPRPGLKYLFSYFVSRIGFETICFFYGHLIFRPRDVCTGGSWGWGGYFYSPGPIIDCLGYHAGCVLELVGRAIVFAWFLQLPVHCHEVVLRLVSGVAGVMTCIPAISPPF